jgi:type VI secretion system protein ImpL
MKQTTKTWLVVIAVFLVYVLIAIGVSVALKLHGGVLWGVVLGLIAAGFISSWLVYRFLRSDQPPAPSGPPAGSPEAVLAAARAQLVSARHVVNPKFGSLPVLLVLGPENSAKTTMVVRSGLDPELLAGDVFRGDTVAPTEAINTWYSKDTVIVEAGGRYINDPPAWSRLIKALRPRSLASALTGRAQPPRLAIVCFPCDEFYRPGSGENVPAAARAVRARLGEAAKAFGVQLPTYVIFTKLDTIAYFGDYVRNLSADEAREPLGAGVAPDVGGAGTYADRVTPALDASFDELYASLADRRIAALSREHAAEFKPGAYEFPREFAKPKPLVVDFVREIGRPSELEVSPVLRGFYFTGVQAVFVAPPSHDNVAAVAAAPKPAVATARSATGVFTPPVAAAVASPMAPSAPSGPARKVPRWDFLPRLFREAVFDDEAAVRVTAAGARVGFWRRLGLGITSVAALLLLIAFIVSYSGNRELETTAIDATRGLATPAPNNVDLPPVDALTRLEALRTRVDTLSRYEHTGAPLHLRWGLYSGDRLYPEVRRAYFGGFDKLMFASTRSGMRAALAALPAAPQPTDDYGATYALLKGYIITTSHPEKSTSEFLSPLLMQRWIAGRPIDSARAQLARRQFDTYATELRYENPFPDTADRATVDKARAFLRGFAGSERIYQFILAEAAKTNPSIQFNKLVPGSAAWVNDSYEVPGAFTKGGAVFVTDALKGVDKYLKGESWVVGDEVGQIDKNQLVNELRTKYVAEYIEQWRKALASASVVRYGSVKDAAQKLTAIAGPTSPLLALFSVASQNTSPAGFPEVAAAFQPPQFVTPPTVTDKLIGQQNLPYMNALLALQASLDKVAGATGAAADAAIAEAGSNAANAKSAALQIANNFTPNPTTRAHELVQRLMLEPITNVEPMLRNFGSQAINNGSKALCAAVAPVLRKFPFAPDASAQATFAEVNDLFKPNTGKLWRFYQETLAGMIPYQGTAYVAQPGNVKINPAFVTLLNKAKIFSDALYANDSQDPHLSLGNVAPQPSEQTPTVTIDIDGQVMKAARNGNQESARVSWPSPNVHQARLLASLGPQEYNIAGPYIGTWAMFQLFNQADEWRPTDNGFLVSWELRAAGQRAVSQTGAAAKTTVRIDVTPQVTQILRKGFFNGADCVGNIAQ